MHSFAQNISLKELPIVTKQTCDLQYACTHRTIKHVRKTQNVND